ncbi:MAG: tetratricopeptide repeat protein [Deltaproteobacteria bacterium]|nr:MAG: tetratricopeptide repeat protein [Deltaproteobacteria bacterium]
MRALGRYRLHRLLGEGGAGRVYDATLAGPGGVERPVAVKVLAGDGAVLRREARLGGLLRHAHLVDVYEVGEVDGQWFCAMERCAGSILTRVPLPPRAVVDVGLQVCEALHYAHEALGLVHLDLKPDNLLYTEAGAVKVADLGIARASGFDGDGRVRGTPGYMPPEQARGGAVDPRADVYALGATLLHLATGARGQASASTWLDTSFGDPDDTQEYVLDAGIGPAWLRPILTRALANEPAERFLDMQDMARALAALEVDGASLVEHLGVRRELPAWSAAIPGEPDDFIGRGEIEDQLLAWLDEGGLITLRGPAGVGKTRLSARLARRWAESRGADGLFLDLTQVRDEDGLAGALGRALDVPLADRHVAEQLGAALAARGELVVVLDNVEQIPGVGGMLAPLLEAAPEARLLATSRQKVDHPNERIHDLAPLSPDAAVALLVARARLRGVELTPSPALEELAVKLDGLPLALELAAGRLGVLSVEDVLERLGKGVLRAAGEDRHATLNAALTWSWELLSEAHRRALAELSVFAGPFALSAAEAVLDLSADDVLATIEALVDRSMLHVADYGRFRLLVSVRDFAAARLAERGDDVVRAAEWRHARFYAERWPVERLRALEMNAAEDRTDLLRSADNMIAALERSIAAGQGETALRCLRAALTVLENQAAHARMVNFAQRVSEMADLSLSSRAMALLVLGLACNRNADLAGSLAALDPGLRCAREAGDGHLEGMIQAQRGTCLLEGGRIAEAEACFREAVRLQRLAGERRWEGVSHADLAVALGQAGRPDEARAAYERALVLTRSAGDLATEGGVLGNLGNLALESGAFDLARAYFEAAIDIHQRLRRWRSHAHAVGSLGLVYAMEGRYEEALPRMQKALEVQTQLGYRRYQGIALGNLGILHEKLGDHEAAVAALREAASLAHGADNPRFESYWLAWVARLEPLADEAPALSTRAIDLARSVGDPATWVEVLAMGAGMWLERGHRARAQALLARAEADLPARHIGAREEVQRVHDMLTASRDRSG